MADLTSRQGISYANPEILDWVHRIHAPHDAVLERSFSDPERLGLPPYQLGPNEARFLELLVRLIGARRIVEVGTLVGYSALRMGRALPADGHLWTLELEAKNAAVARGHIEAAGLTKRVTVVEGPALQSMASLESQGPFDLIFIDADKANYPNYCRWAARNLRPGGVLVGDNAFLFGQLLKDSQDAQDMRRFHEEAVAAFDTACLPTPEGMVIGLRR
jgi:caffeoyl-CoA O-methyltransferase